MPQYCCPILWHFDVRIDIGAEELAKLTRADWLEVALLAEVYTKLFTELRGPSLFYWHVSTFK